MTSVLPLINRCIGSPTRCRRLRYQMSAASSAIEAATLMATIYVKWPSPAMAPATINIGTTAKSWAINTPTVMRPTWVRSSPMSSSILIATAVLLSDTMKPSSTAVLTGQFHEQGEQEREPERDADLQQGAQQGRAVDRNKGPNAELHRDQEQQHQHAQFGKRDKAFGAADESETTGAQQYPGQDVADNGRLAQPDQCEPDDHRHGGDHGNAGEIGNLLVHARKGRLRGS